MFVNPNNPILARDDVGRAKPTTFDLPPDEHLYGKKSDPRVEGVKEIVHKPIKKDKKELPPMMKNYTKININAQGKKFAKRGEYLEFTKNMEIRVKRKIGNPEIENILPDEDFVYGVPNKPSIPIKTIISELIS